MEPVKKFKSEDQEYNQITNYIPGTKEMGKYYWDTTINMLISYEFLGHEISTEGNEFEHFKQHVIKSLRSYYSLSIESYMLSQEYKQRKDEIINYRKLRLKLLFVARFKNPHNVFYKDNLPKDLFHLILNYCGYNSTNFRSK